MLEYAFSTLVFLPAYPDKWNKSAAEINRMLTNGWAPLRETMGTDGATLIAWYRQVAPEPPEDDDDVTETDAA